MKMLRVTCSAVAAVALAACGGSSSPSTSPTPATSASRPGVDARVGLRAGTLDANGTRVVTPAAEAIWNLKLVSATPPSPRFMGSTNSDMAFVGKYVIQGNYNGYQIWDIS